MEDNKIKNSQILVIDDEESILFAFRKSFSMHGYSAITVDGYDKALNVLDEKEIDLVFTDIRFADKSATGLAGKSGIDILREIKKRKLLCPVILITGYADVDSASEALRLGAYDYLIKPIKLDVILRITRVALQHKGVVEELEKHRSNLDAIFANVKDGIITVDKELNIIEVNTAAEKICGMLSNEMKGNKIDSVPLGCRGKCLDSIIKTVKTKQIVEVFRIECNHRNKSNQVINVSTFPLINQNGMLYAIGMVLHDETRIVNLERDLMEKCSNVVYKMIGQSEKMQKVYSLIDNLARVQTSVLITGESGTGKELVAEALHAKGVRVENQLIKVNCAALPEDLLESELFGHVKGAFTGAINDRIGRFQHADGGTLFLDEIGDISEKMQLRLLRVLETMEFERVGDSKTIKVDVRVVTATNKNLYQQVKRGDFREDLFYRLAVVEIHLPALRNRKEDISLLVNYFIDKFNTQFAKAIKGVSSDVQNLFLKYHWYGNIRELKHTLEHAFVLCNMSIITLDCLPVHLNDNSKTEVNENFKISANDIEDIKDVLEKTDGNKSKAARLLGIDRKTLYRRMKKYKI